MKVIRPETRSDAVDALAAHPGADVLAGGTDLMVDVNLDHRRPGTVVAVRRIDELRGEGPTWIGAGVTFAELEHGPHVGLAEAARTVGSPQIRAVATLGGNLGTASPAGDGLPWLAVRDAVVVLESSGGVRRLPWDAFLTGPKQTLRRDDELIVGVELPEPVPVREAFSKVGTRQAMVVATVSCSAARFDDGTVRIALGAVGPTVIRARRAEGFLATVTALDRGVIEELERLVAEEVRPITDHRATAAYRRHAAGVIAARTVERVW